MRTPVPLHARTAHPGVPGTTRSPRRPRILALAIVAAATSGCASIAVDGRPPQAPNLAATATDGPLSAFLGPAEFAEQPLHASGRFPNVVITTAGTVVSVFGGVEVRRSEDGGRSFGPPIRVAEGFMGGGTIVDDASGGVLVFIEEGHPPAPLAIHRSDDDGRSWRELPHTIHPDETGAVPSMHMNESGLTLRRGPHAGRLIRAARHYDRGNDRQWWPDHRTTAIFSDDGGRSWHTSGPFAEAGTGEAGIVERRDGSLVYDSRAHWHADPDDPPLRRRQARSRDGGESWTDWRIVQTLPDGPQDTTYGCMGGFVRLPVEGRDILLVSNCDSDRGRVRGTVWVSFDGGDSWPLKRLVHPGSFAYSSLAAGRPGTPTAGSIFLHFESGGGSRLARFNLAWLLEGEATGDGAVPAWARHGHG